MNNLILNFIIFMKYNKEIVNCIFAQNLAQILRIKKGSKTKYLETLTGVAPPLGLEPRTKNPSKIKAL